MWSILRQIAEGFWRALARMGEIDEGRQAAHVSLRTFGRAPAMVSSAKATKERATLPPASEPACPDPLP